MFSRTFWIGKITSLHSMAGCETPVDRQRARDGSGLAGVVNIHLLHGQVRCARASGASGASGGGRGSRERSAQNERK